MKQNNKSDGGILVNSNEKTWDLTNASDRNDFQSLLAGGDDYIVYVEGYNPGVRTLH